MSLDVHRALREILPEAVHQKGADSRVDGLDRLDGVDQGQSSENHGRIQVACSRDGGATWAVVTPHGTADANDVDHWNQWLAVGPDGSVYVIFYDTRRDPSRASVDLMYSSSPTTERC